MDRSDGDLSGMVGGATLDGEGDDLLSSLVALGANLLLGLTDDGGGLMGDLTADLVEKLMMRIVARQLRDALELGSLPRHEFIKFARTLIELSGLAGKLVLALIERLVATIETLFALHNAVLKRAKLALALLLLGLGGLLALDDLLLGLEQRLFLKGFCRPLGIADNLLGLRMSRLNLRVGLTEAAVLGAAHGEHGSGGPDQEANDTEDEFHAVFSFVVFRQNGTPRRTCSTFARVWSPNMKVKLSKFNLIDDERISHNK